MEPKNGEVSQNPQLLYYFHLEHDSDTIFDDFQNFPNVSTEGIKICSINAQATFIIPPLSEVLVPATLSEQFPTNIVGCVEPRHELTGRYNIIGAAELVTISEQHTIPIRLLNPTNQPIKIYCCTCLGHFSPAEADIATFELVRADVEAETKRDIPMATDTDTRNVLDVDDTELSQSSKFAFVLYYRNMTMFLPIIRNN